MITLASPYPEGVMSVVLSQTSQMVDEDLKPVPLSDVYVCLAQNQAPLLLKKGLILNSAIIVMPRAYAGRAPVPICRPILLHLQNKQPYPCISDSDHVSSFETVYPSDQHALRQLLPAASIAKQGTANALSADMQVHHYGGQANFLIGSGAEIRGSLSRKPLPEPYHMIVNGTEVASQAARLTNIQLINTGWLIQNSNHVHGIDAAVNVLSQS